jgi:hypothetical protein
MTENKLNYIKYISLNTVIQMYNGETKLAKNIKIGDELIDCDGNKKIVNKKQLGNGKMYKIIQNRGENYSVNENHILTLNMPDHKIIFWNNDGWSVLYWDNINKCIKMKHIKAIVNSIICKECGIKLNSCLKRHYSRKHKNVIFPEKIRKRPTNNPDMSNINIEIAFNKMKEYINNIPYDNILNISVKDFIKLNKTTQRRLAGVRGQCVNWEEKNVFLDPYILGLWLGDGMKSGYAYSCQGENDPEIINYLTEWGIKNDAKFTLTAKCRYDISSIDNYGKRGYAPLKKLLLKYNLINNKHIPKEYLINSREIRLKVLAGMIDSDGTVCREGTRICITQSKFHHERLIYNLLYLCRSLGFCCSFTEFDACYKLNNIRKYFESYKLNISGNITDIPTILTRKKCMKTKKQNTDNSTGYIRIEEIESLDFIGLEFNLLNNDFTVI